MADCYNTSQNDSCRQEDNPHFGRDPADIRIRINPEIQIQILNHILALADMGKWPSKSD